MCFDAFFKYDWVMSFNDFLLMPLPEYGEIALAFLRIAIGTCFVIHGLGKLGIVGPGNLEGFTGWLAALGLPFPALQARMAMVSELVGGTALALGLFTRPACLFLFFTMLVATLLGHKGGGYLITNDPPGNEYALNLLILVAVFGILGPGPWSLDQILF